MMSYDKMKWFMVTHQAGHWFMVGLTFPVLSLFILAKGLDYAGLGLVMAIYSGSVVVAELPSGVLSDIIGRKRIYIVSLVLSVAGAAVALLSSGFWGLAAGFCLLGLARAFASGSAEALFIDELYRLRPGEDIRPALAAQGIAVPLSLGAASLLGGALPGMVSASSCGAGNPYAANVAAYLALACVMLIASAVLLPRDGSAKPGEEDASKPAAGETAGNEAVDKFGIDTGSTPEREHARWGLRSRARPRVSRTVMILLAGGAFWGFSMAGLEQLWQPRLLDIAGESFSNALLGLLGAGYFAAAALGAALSNGAFRMAKGRYWLLLGASRYFMGAAFLALVAARGLGPFAVLYFVTFSLNGVAGAPESALYNGELKPANRATMLSLSSLVLQLGGLAGSVALGLIARGRSIGAAWTLASIMLCSSSILYLSLLGWRPCYPDGEGA